MRAAFCQALVQHAGDPKFVFLTGDLGFGALEPLRDAMGERFINAGVAEQNMVSVAAGLARQGFRPWVYSIAPFVYARPFEQIRNDVCFHRLPVVLVGNGGGHAYGVMGASHHAIEDLAVMTCLTGMTAHLPAVDADVPTAVNQLFQATGPAYLRLGLSEWSLPQPPPLACWRELIRGDDHAAVVVVLGPLVGKIAARLSEMHRVARPHLWLCSQLPFSDPPPELYPRLASAPQVIVVEEHVARGGFGEMFCRHLLLSGVAPRRFIHRCAAGYPSGQYGSQQFHRQESGLDAESIAALLQTGAIE